MNDIVIFSAVFAGLALVVVGLAWLANRARRRNVGGSVLGAVDEVFHPAAYQPRIEIQVQAERKAPPTGLGDLPFPRHQ